MKPDYWTILAYGSIILVLGYALLFPALTQNQALEAPGKISVKMTAQVFREGLLLAEHVKEDDLILHNFMNITRALLAWPNDAALDQELTLQNGVALDFTFWNETSDNTIFDTTDHGQDSNYGQGFIGSGTTPPTRGDYTWESVEEYGPYDSSDLGTDDFTLTYIVTASGAFDWTESGWFMSWYSSGMGDMGDVFVFRDTFSAISVEEDDVCVLNYQVTFAEGYTSNFIKVLRSLLMGSEKNGDKYVTLTDSGGSSRPVTTYNDDDDTDFIGHFDNANHGGWIYVSTSSSGIPSRSAYRLLGSSVGATVTSSVDTDNWDVITESVMIPTSAMTVVVAGYFRYTEYSTGEGLFLMYALSHSAVYVAEDTAVKAEFTLEM